MVPARSSQGFGVTPQVSLLLLCDVSGCWPKRVHKPPGQAGRVSRNRRIRNSDRQKRPCQRASTHGPLHARGVDHLQAWHLQPEGPTIGRPRPLSPLETLLLPVLRPWSFPPKPSKNTSHSSTPTIVFFEPVFTPLPHLFLTPPISIPFERTLLHDISPGQ